MFGSFAATPRPFKLLVFGGNGFVGSSICKSAVARGWQVVSISRSGKPFETPAGQRPDWTQKVEWHAGSPFDLSTFAPVLSSCDGVVSTLGILLEKDYKNNGSPSLFGTLSGFLEGLSGGRGNPLKPEQFSYERMNRDAALSIFDAFAATPAPPSPTKSGDAQSPSPFVYLSAEDIFRPFVPSRYIETKREAEFAISAQIARHRQGPPSLAREIRPLFIRPSLIYHPHLRPISTLPASMIGASAYLHSLLPGSSKQRVERTNLVTNRIPSAATSMQSLLRIPPIHVDTIAESVCKKIEDPHAEGVVDVRAMRKIMGFDDPFDRQAKNDSPVVFEYDSQ